MTFSAYAQDFPCDLYGEGSGTVIKLKCIPEAWPADLEGYHIKRRELISKRKSTEWKQLSKVLLQPHISKADDYSNVEPSITEQQRLKEKFDRLLEAGSTSEISTSDFIQNHLNDSSGIGMLTMGFLVDYDYALFQGFGFIDRNVPKGKTFEYGLFAKFKDQDVQITPTSVYTWKSGTVLDLEVSYESKIKVSRKKNNTKVTWVFDTKELKEKRITAFKVVRQNNAGTQTIIKEKTFIDASIEKAKFVVRDKNSDDVTTGNIYFAIPITTMGTEGKGFRVVYTEETAEIELQQVPEILFSERLADNQLAVEWKFTKEDEQFLEGFYVVRQEKNRAEIDSFFVSSDARRFRDSLLISSGDYTYQVNTFNKNKSTDKGAGFKVSFEFIEKLLPPQEVKGELLLAANKTVELKWGKAESKSDTPLKYRIYVATPFRDYLTYSSSIPDVEATTFSYNINQYGSGYWKFAVSTIGKNGKESELSETITVLVPSTSIPPIANAKFTGNGSTGTINWVYYADQVVDLSGFRLYQDGKLVADEQTLTVATRSWTVQNLREGKNNFSLEAITTSGVTSSKINGTIRY